MGARATDLTGQVFGRLKVLGRYEDKSSHVKWQCKCKCGRKCVVEGRNLKSGKTRSCGCIQRGTKKVSVMGARAEERSSASRNNLARDEEFEPYQDLANAIICVAADDYRAALREENDGLKRAVESFFFSDWYEMLTRVPPMLILSKLRHEYYSSRREQAIGSY